MVASRSLDGFRPVFDSVIKNMELKKKSENVNIRGNNVPKHMERSFMAMETFEKFEETHKKAVNHLNSNNVEADGALTTGGQHDAIPYLLRPVLSKGDVCLLHASHGLGKTAFVYSLCASVVAGNRLFQEKWWTVPRREGEVHKVLYLDFESSRDQLDSRRKTFVTPFLPPDPEARKLCQGNFIVKDLVGDITNYPLQANHRKIMDMLEDAKEQGNPGQPVDLVVFDTCARLVGNEESIDWERLRPLMDKIRATGVAALIVHHANGDGSREGFMDNFAAIVKLGRSGDASAPLDEPMKVEIQKLRNGNVSIDHEPFQIKFVDNKWTVHEPKRQDALEEFGLIVRNYQQDDYPSDAIAQMMGMSKATFSSKMKECKEKYNLDA